MKTTNAHIGTREELVPIMDALPHAKFLLVVLESNEIESTPSQTPEEAERRIADRFGIFERLVDDSDDQGPKTRER